ncbi:MAG: pentapeptide repeat-containing protein [Rhodospirillaceae bacterium]|nr:pentapeptide repeat-containing protein [Rhodospirillaceae bacterium]MBT5666454.1 pentapeptide repeat-containing protein [Rhodospirillaceae bacterium]MBT5809635.1 pentapeptide repeat-containing protein [Rhodospirillaceae bacterium]
MTDSETDDLMAFEALVVSAILLVGFWPDLGLTAAPTIFSWKSWGVGDNNTATVSDVLRNGGLLVVAILALSVGTWRAVTARRQADIANEQARLAERGLFTDRFSRAVANVSSGDLAIRLGGIDALCRMAAEAQGEDYETVMDMLCAFVRVPPHRDKEATRVTQRKNLAALRAMGGKGAAGAKGEETTALLREDIQEILDRLFKGDEQGLSRGGYRADFRHADLRGAFLFGANLIAADLSGADLSEVYFIGADLSEANLPFANFTRAKLSGANLNGADLYEAILNGAVLNGADLSGVNLTRADLSKAQSLTQAQLDVACVREGGDPPKLPEGLTPPTKTYS